MDMEDHYFHCKLNHVGLKQIEIECNFSTALKSTMIEHLDNIHNTSFRSKQTKKKNA